MKHKTNATTEYLTELHKAYRARQEKLIGKELPFCEDRPKSINYKDGTKIILENDKTYPTIRYYDKVTIKKGRKSFVLNDMTGTRCSFFDDGEGFEFSECIFGEYLVKYCVIYGSLQLEKSKTNVYTLLHELSHLKLAILDKDESKLELEVSAWKEADGLAKEMGLVLFDKAEEKKLYRDVCLRTYDPFNEKGAITTGLMKDITYARFDSHVISGLMEAAHQGESLVKLCNGLLEK